MKPCLSCGSWSQKQQGADYCEPCLQRNAMKYVQPSAPPSQYTYAVPYQQQQMYNYYQARPPQQPQIGTGTAVLGGVLLGALAEDILDPTE